MTLEVDNAQQMAALNRESSRLERALASWLKRPCRIRLILKEQAPLARQVASSTRLLNWTSMCRALIFQGW